MLHNDVCVRVMQESHWKVEPYIPQEENEDEDEEVRRVTPNKGSSGGWEAAVMFTVFLLN